MAVRSTGWGGTAFLTAEHVTSASINDTLNLIGGLIGGGDATFMPPVGTIIGWHKCFGIADSGTTTSASANKLIQTGQNFQTTVVVGMIVKNTTDSTYAYVTAVDSDTQLTINADIMGSTENFTIYKTRALPDGWVECDGSVLSDAESIFNGATLENINNSVYIRGYATNAATGGTGGSNSHSHNITRSADANSASGSSTCPTSTGSTNAEPPFTDFVFIMRVK